LRECRQVGGPRQAAALAGDRGAQVGDDRGPRLHPDRGRGAVEGEQAQVLFDPAKEQLDLPALPIELGDDAGRQLPLIGPESEMSAVFHVEEADATHRLGPMLARVLATKADGLVAAQRSGTVDRARLRDITADVVAFAHHEEGAALVQATQAAQVDVATIHDVEGARLNGQRVELGHVAMRALGYGKPGGQGTAQVELGVELHRRVGTGPVGPMAEGEAQGDQRGIDGVEGRVQIERVGLGAIKRAGARHQPLRQLGEQRPGADFIVVGQGAASERTAEPEVIPQRGLSLQAGHDVAQTLPKRQLRETQCEQVLPTAEVPVPIKLAMPLLQPSKLPSGHGRHDLREHCRTGKTYPAPRGKNAPELKS
jgi:hypothetical protein